MRQPERVLVLLMVAGAAGAGAAPADLEPFRATYVIEWKGITAGHSTLELKPDGADRYRYSSVSGARGMFRMAFSDSISQTTTFRLADGKVVPLAFRGADEKERPTELDFDWQRNRVSGVAKGHAVDLPLPAGTQDPMSMQIAALRNLASGSLEEKVTLVDGDRVKEYEMRREGNVQLETALGTLDTLVYTSNRAGSDRVTRTWVAPALGYLPVKAQRTRGTKVEFTMLIQSVD